METAYVDVRGQKLHNLQDVFRHTGRLVLMPGEFAAPPAELVSGTPPAGVISARPYGSPAGTEPPWMTIREFDWTNPEHVRMRVRRLLLASMRDWHPCEKASQTPAFGRFASSVAFSGVKVPDVAGRSGVRLRLPVRKGGTIQRC